MAGEWQYEEWQHKPKTGLNASSSSFGGGLNNEFEGALNFDSGLSGLNNEKVDWRKVYGPSFGYGNLGYGDLGYGPSLEESVRSLQPTGTRRGVNWSRLTVEPRARQNGEADSTDSNLGGGKSVAGRGEIIAEMPALNDKTLSQPSEVLASQQANAPKKANNSDSNETAFQDWLKFQNQIRRFTSELEAFWQQVLARYPQDAKYISDEANKIWDSLVIYLASRSSGSTRRSHSTQRVELSTIIYSLMVQRFQHARLIIEGKTTERRARDRQSLLDFGKDTNSRHTQLENFYYGVDDPNNSFGGIKDPKKQREIDAKADEIYTRVTQYDSSWQDLPQRNKKEADKLYEALYAACKYAALLWSYREAREIVGGSAQQRSQLAQLFSRLPQQSPPNAPDTISQQLINDRARRIFQAISGKEPNNSIEEDRQLLEALRNAILIQWTIPNQDSRQQTLQQNSTRSSDGRFTLTLIFPLSANSNRRRSAIWFVRYETGVDEATANLILDAMEKSKVQPWLESRTETQLPPDPKEPNRKRSSVTIVVNTKLLPQTKVDRQSTENQSAPPLTPVERFRELLKQKALQQLQENRGLIQEAQKKYLQPNPETLGNLRQVVEADERLESAQKKLENRQRIKPELWLDENRNPAVKNKLTLEEGETLRQQNQAKLDQIKQVRYTLLQLYPASGLLKARDVKPTNNDDPLLRTLSERFENILENIRNAEIGIQNGDIPLLELEGLIEPTRKEIPEADRAAVDKYIQDQRNRKNNFRLIGFLSQIGLAVGSLFVGGLIATVMKTLAAALGIGQSAYEFEEAEDLNTVANTGGEAGGNQLLSDPDAARINYVMGWVNVALAGLEAVSLTVKGAGILISKGLRGAEQIVNLPEAEVLARVTPKQIWDLERARQLRQAGNFEEASSILAGLEKELDTETYEQLQRVWQKSEETVSALGTATSIANALPDDLQGIPITFDERLPSKKIEVHYTRNVEVRVAPDVDPNDLRLHAPTIRYLLEFKETESWASKLLAHLKEWLTKNPQAQSKLWEAQQELEKLPNFIYSRATKLAALPPNSSEAATLIAEIQVFQENIYDAVGTIVRMDGGPGIGFIAAPGRPPDNSKESFQRLLDYLGKQEYMAIVRNNSPRGLNGLGLQLMDEVLTAALKKTKGNVEEAAKLAADCLRGVGTNQNMSFQKAKNQALERLNNPAFLAKAEQARLIAQEAEQISGGNRTTGTYVEKKLEQELKGRPQLFEDPNAKAEVLTRITGRIAALDAQTPDELLEEIDTLEAQLEPYERQLGDLQNRKKYGQLDDIQEERLKKLTEELIPPLETELDYIDAVRTRKLRPELPESANRKASDPSLRFPQKATIEEAFALLKTDSSFGLFYQMLIREGFASEEQVLKELAKISYQNKRVTSVSSALKRIYRPTVIDRLANPDPALMREKYRNLAWPRDTSQDVTSPAYTEARHRYFLNTIRGLNSGDIGSIGEGWFQKLYSIRDNQTQAVVSQTQVPISQSDMAQQGITLTQDRKLDEVYGNTIREQKTVSGVLVESQNSKEAIQFREYAELAAKKATISVNGNNYEIENLVYVFPVPEGVRANAKWMRQELGRRRDYLSFEIFNTRGERKIVDSDNIQELQDSRLSNWLGLENP